MITFVENFGAPAILFNNKSVVYSGLEGTALSNARLEVLLKTLETFSSILGIEVLANTCSPKLFPAPASIAKADILAIFLFSDSLLFFFIIILNQTSLFLITKFTILKFFRNKLRR